MRKKEIIELSVTVTCGVVLIFVLANAAKKPRLRSNLKANPAALVVMPQAQTDQKISSKDLYSFLEKQAQSIELKRDPFSTAPLVIEKDTQSGVSLTGILWDKDKPMAIINGNVVEVGQSVGNQTVTQIRQDKVILSDGAVFSEVELQN